MRKDIFILLLTFVVAMQSNAQGDFAPIGAEWYYALTGTINYVHYSHFWVEKDTVVADINCRKNVVVYVPHPPHFDYRYTAPPEDSLFKSRVKSVEVVNIGGKTVKQIRPFSVENDRSSWYFRGGTYMKRIGSLYFLIPHSSPGIPEDYGIGLRCYKDHEISYQLVEPCDTLIGQPSSIRQPVYSKAGISIFPNPSFGNFMIKMAVVASDPLQALLTDIAGRPVTKFIIPKGEKELVCLLDLSAGIYSLKWAEQGKILCTKIGGTAISNKL